VNLGVRPFDEFAVHPDKAIKLIEGDGCHGNLPRAAARTSFWFSVQSLAGRPVREA
jgi:hypothetical protein